MNFQLGTGQKRLINAPKRPLNRVLGRANFALSSNLMMPDTPDHFQSIGVMLEDFREQTKPQKSPKNVEKLRFMAKICPYMIILLFLM